MHRAELKADNACPHLHTLIPQGAKSDPGPCWASQVTFSSVPFAYASWPATPEPLYFRSLVMTTKLNMQGFLMWQKQN